MKVLRERGDSCNMGTMEERERGEEYLVMDLMIERRREGDPRREKREREHYVLHHNRPCY